MIYRGIDFYNVAEVEEIRGSQAVRMHRFPEHVRAELGWGKSTFGRYVADMTTGCELRFVLSGDRVAVSLSTLEADGDVLVYKGQFFHSRHRLTAGVVKTLQLSDTDMFANLQPSVFAHEAFSHRVWRILFCHDFTGVFHGIEAYGFRLRPPKPDEVPARRWLAYGSSITHGAGALFQSNAYVSHAARLLGVDVLNKGMGGSCFCEQRMAEYLTSAGELSQWDFATLELGVNMRNAFTPEEFSGHAGELVEHVLSLNRGKPVFLITAFHNAAGHRLVPDVTSEREESFNRILREMHQRWRGESLFLNEGSEILDRFSMLSCDLVHPSETGHADMGRNLAGKLAACLPDDFYERKCGERIGARLSQGGWKISAV